MSDKSAGCTTGSAMGEALKQLAIIPAQLYGAPPMDHLREDIATGFSLGERTVERPIELETPILLAGTPDSYTHSGTRLALIHGAGIARTMVDCGWYGILPEEQQLAGEVGAKTAFEITASRLGKIGSIQSGDSMILSIVHTGTGSVDGKAGSVILPEMLAPEIRRHLGLDELRTLISPSRFLDMDTPRDLNKLVQLVRELTAHEIPVLVKVGAGQVYEDVRIAINARPDGVVLDCTRAPAPSEADDEIADTAADAIGTPPLGTLAPLARAKLDGKAEKNDVKLIYAGDIGSGADIFKLMAFGASAVMLSGIPLAKAGIGPRAAEQPGPNFEPASAGVRIAQFLSDVLMELKALTAWTGHDSTGGIITENLRAVNYNTAAVTGLKLIGYEKILTMWEH
jgi:hypothetical protein